MNPDEFARLKFKPPLEQEVLAAVLEGPPGWKPSDEAIYELLTRIFAKHMERFRYNRSLCRDMSCRQLARLPGGNALVLWPAGATLLRGKHAPDHAPERASENGLGPPVTFERIWDGQPWKHYDSGAWQAARIIVGGCGPRFHRALQVIERATELLMRYRISNVVGGDSEPRESNGKNGPYR